MIFTGSQWLSLYEDTDHSKVDYEAVTLALMFDHDDRLADCDDALTSIIDNMAPDTVRAHTFEFYAANFT